MTDVRDEFCLDPSWTFLNHGSFGACPRSVLEVQRALRDRLESQPVRFMVRELESLLDAARADIGTLVGADPDDLASVSNATSGVNTVLRSLRFAPDDEILITDHGYNACNNAAAYAARVVTAKVPFPLASEDEVVDAVLDAVTDRTRLALLDHVTSPTAVIFPIARLVRELAARGIDTLVDGAHAPGMLPLDVHAIGAAYYTGNLHKWVCAPKGAAFLHVRRDRQDAIRPLTISHGANSPRRDRTRFRLEFDWTGTQDPTAFLTVPAAIAFLRTRELSDHMTQNHRLALAARDVLCRELEVYSPCPDAMVGAMASIPLPDARRTASRDALQTALVARNIEVPLFPWPCAESRCLRISAQIYNRREQYIDLARALREIVAAE